MVTGNFSNAGKRNESPGWDDLAGLARHSVDRMDKHRGWSDASREAMRR